MTELSDQVTRDHIEKEVGKPLTESQWEEIRDEIAIRVSQFADELVYNIIEDYKEGFYDDVL